MVFPLVFVPQWVSELNLMLLAAFEPLFLVMEVVQLVSLVRWSNSCAQYGIDNQPSVWKVRGLYYLSPSLLSLLKWNREHDAGMEYAKVWFLSTPSPSPTLNQVYRTLLPI